VAAQVVTKNPYPNITVQNDTMPSTSVARPNAPEIIGGTDVDEDSMMQSEDNTTLD